MDLIKLLEHEQKAAQNKANNSADKEDRVLYKGMYEGLRYALTLANSIKDTTDTKITAAKREGQLKNHVFFLVGFAIGAIIPTTFLIYTLLNLL